MSSIIKNFSELATSPIRNDALTIAEAGLRSIDTVTVLEDSISIADAILTIQGRHFDLESFRHVYVIGFGKVACTAAYTLERLLEDRVSDGAVIGIAEKTCRSIDTYAGTHPLPSQQNYIASKHIAEVARSANKDDLVLVIVSGGGSALLCSSMGECDQGVQLFESFLPSGGTIEELNVVRKHISKLKGGGLAKALYPATVVGLVFSDVPGGDMAAVASGPTYLDTSTITDAKEIIDRYKLGSFHLLETPKDPKYFQRVHNFTMVSNVTALSAMQQAAESRSYRAELVATTQYATAEETKALLLKRINDGVMQCMGGETKITVPDGVTGSGGRNSYLALSMLEELSKQQVFISLASDGHDNTPIAGALADYETRERAKQAGLSVAEHLAQFNSLPFFQATRSSIETGPLESNVSDLMLLLTAQKPMSKATIDRIVGEIVKDSRGKETLSITVVAGPYQGTFAVPSGASTGESEVAVVAPKKALRVLKNVVAPALIGMSVTEQEAIDGRLHEIDGSERFENIGGNLALGVSVATLKAAAAAKGIEPHQQIAELFQYREQAIAPRLFVNLINGGKHARGGSPIQEHQIIPETDNVQDAFTAAKAIQRALKKILLEDYSPKEIAIGDEGGFVVPTSSLEESYTYIEKAIAAADLSLPVLLGTDIAASSFCKDGHYQLLGEKYDQTAMLDMYSTLHQRFPLLLFVEDPFAEQDMTGFYAYRDEHPSVLTIGDDLTTTNADLLDKAIAVNAVNALIIKPNQIGTVSDTLATMALAYDNKVWCIVSHRSGETEDDFIADLAWGTKCFGLKAGAPNQSERAIKYNRLIRIQAQNL